MNAPQIFARCLLLLICICPPLMAADPLGLETNNNSGSVLGLEDDSEPNFLRVEEAYRVTINRLGDGKLALDWAIAPGYYLYKDRFSFKVGDSKPRAELEPGVVKYDEYFQEEVATYHDRTRVVLSGLPAAPFQLQVTSQGCADAGLCYPPYKQTFAVDEGNGAIVEVGAVGPSSGSAAGEGNAAVPFSLGSWLASILFAMIGGMILNLMPCVFPVLSIKALSIANSHQSNHRLHLHGWAYAGGCIATFVVIAGIMLALRAGGEAIGWGFQLQSPIVITGLLYLFFFMGLSFSGAIELGSGLMGIGQNATQGNQLHHSWMTGALASVVASPCTAPMMGAALGYAITQPAVIALSIFAALGFGMALPFLVLTYLPAVAKALPKPGPWMDTLKQALSFPLYLSCVWLLWVLANQTNSNHIAVVTAGMVLIAFAIWLAKHLPQATIGRRAAQGVMLVAVATAGYGALSFKPAAPDALWESYSPERLAELRNEGRAVFVNLTASWCITCLANERVALGTDAVREAMGQQGIQGLKGDWTNADPEITELLRSYGRSGVPLYLFFPPQADANAVVLPQLLTPEIVLNSFSSQEDSKLAINSDI